MDPSKFLPGRLKRIRARRTSAATSTTERLLHPPVLPPLANVIKYGNTPEPRDDFFADYAFDSAECVDVITSWIEECLQDHAKCSVEGPKSDPTKRHLELVKITDEPLIRLIDVQPSHVVPYYALSHCWGKHQVIRTTTRNLSKHQKQVPWESLSYTFRDAIQLVGKLYPRFGIRHVWIDSLCIIQDSSFDWAAEAAKMATLYEDAFLAIAATGAADGRYGIFQPRSPRVQMKKEIVRHDAITGEKTFDAYTHDLFTRSPVTLTEWIPDDYAEHDNPLFNRAWAMQERLLATRCLHFTRGEMIMECKSGIRCECGAFQRRQESWLAESMQKLNFDCFVASTSQDTPKAWDDWWYYVERFATRQVTKSTDVLPAISGVARKAASSAFGEYCAGMWRNGLEHNLLWGKPDFIGRAYPDISARKVSTVAGPSWSWVSNQPGIGIKFRRRYDSKRTYPTVALAEVLDVKCIPSGPDPFGHVSEGVLTIRGYTIEAKAFQKEKGDHIYLRQTRWPHVNKRNYEHMDQHGDLYCDGDINSGIDRVIPDHTLIKCLLIATETETHNYRDHGEETATPFPYISETMAERASRLKQGYVKEYRYPKRKDEDHIYQYRRQAEEMDFGWYNGLALLPVKGRPGTYRRSGLCKFSGYTFGGLIEGEGSLRYIETLKII